MAKNKVIEFIQTDSPLYIDTFVRGLTCIYSMQESCVVVDLRDNKSDVLWTLYDKKNIKFKKYHKRDKRVKGNFPDPCRNLEDKESRKAKTEKHQTKTRE